MPILQSGEYVFKYDHSKSVKENFDNWRILNHEERSAWGEALLTYEEAQKVFEAQYSVKVSAKNG
jgi:hypothetical protein